MSAALFAADTVRYSAGMLLGVAALGKSFSLASFRTNLHESFRLPLRVAMWLAPAIILVEALLAISISAGSGSARPAMAAALVMFFIFTVVLAYRFLQEGLIRCACFGEPERAVSALDLLRNLLILSLMTAWLVLAPAGGAAALQPLAAGMAAFCTIALIGLHDIVSILRGDGAIP